MTPTQRAAIEQALEALNAIPLAFMNTHKDVANVRRARTNIAAALAEPVSVQEPVVYRESSWFALVMNAAAEIEDASNCLRDPDAKRTAIRGAEYYRNAAKAMSKAQPAVEPAQAEPSFAQRQQILDGLAHCYGSDSRHEFLKVWIRDWTFHKVSKAQQPAPPADVPIDADLSDSDYATIAGLEASIGHLSRLVDEQRELIAQLTNVPMLTADEKLQIALDCNMRIRSGSGAVKFATAIEQAVRQKAGLQ